MKVMKMSQRMNLDELNSFFLGGMDFELTDAQYQEKVGKPLPKNTASITGKTTPIGRKAAENGFKIQIKETPVIQRTLIFTKIRN